MFCIFHSSCCDFLHQALSIIVVFSAIMLSIALCYVVGWCINCAVHTSECNNVTIDNARKIQELTMRINSLECKMNSKELIESNSSFPGKSFMTTKIRMKFK